MVVGCIAINVKVQLGIYAILRMIILCSTLQIGQYKIAVLNLLTTGKRNHFAIPFISIENTI